MLESAIIAANLNVFDEADIKKIKELHSSSGTTGKPTVTAYTQNDLDIWGECIARGLTMAGAKKDHIIQNAYGYGLFTGGVYSAVE